jgi:hypothetical protein
MTNEQRAEQLLSQSIEIQTGILKLLALPHVADIATMNQKAVALRRDFGFSDELLVAITGVRPDNLRTALEREGLV